MSILGLYGASREGVSKLLFCCFLPMLVMAGCKEETRQKPSETPVEIQIVHSDTLAQEVVFSGTLEATQTYQLAFMVSGEVTSVQVSAGQQVAKGAMLATLGSNEYRQAYEAAKARVEQATDQYRRLKNMYEANSLTKGDLLEITSKKEEAEAKLAEYRKKLNRTTLKSPASGVVEQVSIAEGEVIKEGVPVITVVQSDQLYATFNIPEADIHTVEVGDSCRVSFEEVGISALSRSAIISKIEPSANPLSRSFKAYAAFDNESNRLKPGMLAQIRIPGKNKTEAIVVNPGLLVRRNNTLNLWTVTNGRATLKRVLTGGLTTNKIQITKGIQPGDTLIESGGIRLSEGEAVKVVE